MAVARAMLVEHVRDIMRWLMHALHTLSHFEGSRGAKMSKLMSVLVLTEYSAAHEGASILSALS
jgi:hypothetical protein